METLIQATLYMTTSIFTGLGAVTLERWRRHRRETERWAALTFGALAIVTLESAIVGGSHVAPGIAIEKTTIAILVLFPYFLYRFTTSFGGSRPLVRTTVWMTAGLLVATALVPDFPEGGQQPAWSLAYSAAFLAQWNLLSFLAAHRLWRAGHGQPTLARRRMRTLSLASTGMMAALLIAVAASAGAPEIVELLVQLLALGSGVGFFVGLVPPRALRQAWRRREEEALQDAIARLMGATTVDDVTQVLLPHVAAFVGAQRAVLIDRDGRTIASHSAQAERELEEPAEQGSYEDIELRPPFRSLQVWTTPYTPFFGADDIRVLHSLAALADLALGRTVLTSKERESRLALERANEELTVTNDELSREVAERERAEATLRKQADLLDLTMDNIFVLDLDSTIRYWNRGAEQTYGWSAEQVVGISIHELLETEFPAALSDIREQLLSHGCWEGELRHTRRDGSKIVASSRWALQMDDSGEPIAILETTNDITARKEAELALVDARSAAENANRAKSEFLSRMSHELRTPLNAILGFGQLLEMDELDAHQRESVTHVLKAGRHLLGLIDEVLEIARIEAGHLTVSAEPVKAADVVREAIDMVSPIATERGISIEVERDGGVYVVADRQRLKQVLLNLLANAIKFNDDDGTVAISFTHHEDRLRFDVRDTGPGIPEDRMNALFVPFDRLGAEGSEVEGTGLGLALSQNLVQVMGGVLSAQSTIGAGSTFSVDLPIAANPLETVDDSGEVRAKVERVSAGTKILYIEDNLSNLRLIEQVLRLHSSAQLITAMQGRIGLDLARRHRPDIILLDLHLPDIPGDEVLRRLREDEDTRDLPVVMISADATKRSARALLEQGANDYLTKPLDIPRFLDVLADHLAERVS